MGTPHSLEKAHQKPLQQANTAKSGRKQTWTARTNAWTARHRLLLDFLTALAFLIFPALLAQGTGCDGLLIGQPQQAGLWWTLAYALPLACRHKYPDLCAWLTVGLLALRLFVGPLLLISDMAALAALFAGVARGNQRFRWWYAGLGVALPIVFAGLDAFAQIFKPLIGKNSLAVKAPDMNVVVAIIGVMLALATTAYARHQAHIRRQTTLLRERNAALALSNRQKEQEAAIAERARLARDMHDVAAHTLSILIVLADGGRYAGAHNSAVALSTMRTIKKQADDSLRNTTALLGPLELERQEDGSAGVDSRSPVPPRARAATDHQESGNNTVAASSSQKSVLRHEQESCQPSYAHIDALVQEAQTSALGRLNVQRTVKGQPAGTVLAAHPLLSETLYRMVEESLSNIRKYAGLQKGRHVHALIEETWQPGRVQISVQDDGQGFAAAADGHSAGYGLIGMRERVEACGGTLVSGPLPAGEGGGFRVAATIPLPNSREKSTASPSGAEDAANPAEESVQKTVSTHSAPNVTPGGHPHAPVPTTLRQPRAASRVSLTDIIIAVAICVLAAMFFLPEIFSSRSTPYIWVSYIGAIGCAVPLVFLHPSPEKPAMITASVMGAAIIGSWILLEPLPGLSLVCGLWALYSVVAFGPERAMKWVRPACVGLVLLAVSEGLCHFAFRPPSAESVSVPRLMAIGVSSLLVYGATVLVVIGLGKLHRDRGEDPVLVAERRQALLRQREQAGRLAARRERERISQQIHQEVARTLQTMSDQAGKAVIELEKIDARSQKSGTVSARDSETIATLFAQTAATGRSVLGHIRELIGVLRRNESEEEAAHVLLTPLHGTPQKGTIKIDSEASEASKTSGKSRSWKPLGSEETDSTSRKTA